MHTIYMATNTVNGQSYIGKDSNWPHRKAAHKHAATRGSDLAFHRAIRKHGWENFRWVVLKEVESSVAADVEQKLIEEYNTFCDGYNMTEGGDGSMGWSPTAETRQKISEANKGKPAWNKGKKCSWVTRRNRSNLGIKRPKQEKQYILTSPCGTVYHVKGLAKFAKEHGLTLSNLTSVATGKLRHHKKWTCVYAEHKYRQ